MSTIGRRKREHLDALAQDPAIERGGSGFAVADAADDEVRQGAGEVEVAVARLGVDDAL